MCSFKSVGEIMAKVFGILLIVLGIWVGLEVMTEGSAGAFGGWFAKTGLVDQERAPAPAPAAQRAANAVGRAYSAGENRVDRQLDQGSE